MDTGLWAFAWPGLHPEKWIEPARTLSGLSASKLSLFLPILSLEMTMRSGADKDDMSGGS